MEEEDIPELKAYFQRFKNQKSDSGLFVGSFDPGSKKLFSRDSPRAMDEESFFTPGIFQPNSMRNISSNRRQGMHLPPRQSFDSIFTSVIPERDMDKLHEKHVIVKKEGAGRFGVVYKCTDLEDCKIKALKVIKYKCKTILSLRSEHCQTRGIHPRKVVKHWSECS